MSTSTANQNGLVPVASQLRQSLETALLLPKSNRSISDFLFSELLNSPFHRNHPLPPAKLSTCVTLSTAQRFQTNPNLLYPPSIHHTPFPNHLVTSSLPADPTVTSLRHAIYIPVATLPPTYTLGYFLDHDPDHDNVCFRANPFAPPCAGRFVSDSLTGDIIHIVFAGVPKCIGIRASVAVTDCHQGVLSSCVEQYLLAVPAVEYEWPYLPKLPIWMMSQIQYRTRPPEQMPEEQKVTTTNNEYLMKASAYTPSCEVLDATDSALQPEPFPSRRKGTITLQKPQYFQPWVQQPNDNGILSDGTSIPASNYYFNSSRSTNGSSSSSMTAGGLFDEIKIRNSVSELRNALAGSFYTPSIRMDSPAVADYSSTFTGRLLATTLVTDCREMIERFASMYYMDVLSASSGDERFLSVPGCNGCENARDAAIIEREVVELIENNHFDMMDGSAFDALVQECESWELEKEKDGFSFASSSEDKPPKCNELKRLEPRPLVTSSTDETKVRQCEDDSSGGKGIELGMYQSREKLLAARKHRNRLSAARSNDKKKKWVEQLAKDIEEGRRKVRDLEKRREQVMAENSALKCRAGYSTRNAQ